MEAAGPLLPSLLLSSTDAKRPAPLLPLGKPIYSFILILIKYPTQTIFFANNSEQMLVDCDPYNNGCNGGMYDRAWRFIKEKGGAMKASAYAYTSGTSGAVNIFSLNAFFKIFQF